MKFTLFALVAAFCLLSVHANFVDVEPYEDVDELSPFDVADIAGLDEDVEFDAFIINSLWRVLRGTLRATKGLNCMIKWVVGIKDSALTFNNGIVSCGQDLGKQVQAMVNANVAIISTCNDIINLKSNVCANTDDDDSTDPVAKSCWTKTLRTIWKLKKQVQKVVNMSKKVPKTGVDSGACVMDKVNTLTAYYTQFPSYIKQCSQLTSS